MSGEHPSVTQQITPLDRRAIEIQVASAFHRAAIERVGGGAAHEILTRAVGLLACDTAASLSSGEALSLSDLWGVWQVLGADERLDLHLDALDDHELRFHVDRCAYADVYTEMGLANLGIEFSCRRDKPFAEALVPGVKVEQFRTILEGASCCEFTYTLEER